MISEQTLKISSSIIFAYIDENSNLDALNLSFKYIIIPGRPDGCGSWLLVDKKANMWHGRENSCGSWLLEDKKANMWHGRENSFGLWLPCLKDHICDLAEHCLK